MPRSELASPRLEGSPPIILIVVLAAVAAGAALWLAGAGSHGPCNRGPIGPVALRAEAPLWVQELMR